MISRIELKKHSWLPVTHIESGRQYIVIGTCKMKNSTTREWEPAVMYIGIDKNTNKQMTFVREISDFQKQFELA